VALLEGNGGKAKELFGHLVGQKSGNAGEGAAGNAAAQGAAVGPAATKDPLVLPRTHLYIGRIIHDEGDHDPPREENPAAALTEGAPEAARHAAQRALDKKR
jgi:hypothetical protein